MARLCISYLICLIRFRSRFQEEYDACKCVTRVYCELVSVLKSKVTVIEASVLQVSWMIGYLFWTFLKGIVMHFFQYCFMSVIILLGLLDRNLENVSCLLVWAENYAFLTYGFHLTDCWNQACVRFFTSLVYLSFFNSFFALNCPLLKAALVFVVLVRHNYRVCGKALIFSSPRLLF